MNNSRCSDRTLCRSPTIYYTTVTLHKLDNIYRLSFRLFEIYNSIGGNIFVFCLCVGSAKAVKFQRNYRLEFLQVLTLLPSEKYFVCQTAKVDKVKYQSLIMSDGTD